jgi:F0F1-type ATP synthase membrane subunit a
MDTEQSTHNEAPQAGITVHLNPYIVGHIGETPITATLLTVWLVMVLLIIAAITVKSKLSLVPGRLQSIFELIVGGAYTYVADVLEDKKVTDK